VKYVVAASVPRIIAANRQYRSTAQLPYHPADCGAYNFVRETSASRLVSWYNNGERSEGSQL